MSNTAPAYRKLIEVAMPIKEVSAESVRDKSIRHGHISTLHLWWARRPLPVCRAVVFASLVPDPDDPNCPPAFREGVELILGKSAGISGDPYMPYDDIPYTSAVDRLDDTPRNRLLMFIGKFSDTFARNEKAGKITPPKDQLNLHSLIRWENKNDEAIIERARKLIWVAYNAIEGANVTSLILDFSQAYEAIKTAEYSLYNTVDRHLPTQGALSKEDKLKKALESFLDRMPRVFDPFAGGGAIPLEAARLGCRSFGNDINPVAHIIQRGSVEFPQRYGKPITYSRKEFIELYGEKELRKQQAKTDFLGEKSNSITLPNRLAFDVEVYARQMLKDAKEEIGYLYPEDQTGRAPIAYYWARVAKCANPSCKAEVPLLRGFNLCNKPKKKISLSPIIDGNTIAFEIKKGLSDESWIKEGNLTCPCCKSVTENRRLKEQFYKNEVSDRLIVVIYDGIDGKEYVLPTDELIQVKAESKKDLIIPSEALPVTYSKAMAFFLWNFNNWGDIYSEREIIALNSLLRQVNKFSESCKNDYDKCILTYLAMLFNRVASRMTTFGLWNTIGEKIEHPFGKSAIQMVFDYPESNIFAKTGGGALNQMEWIIRYINSESVSPFIATCANSASGDIQQFQSGYFDAVVTDPPYYDAVAYADLSDFYYVWMKHTLNRAYPLEFATPMTPKADECTALKHHHNESANKAELHFERKLIQIFDALRVQTKGIVSIMYAHQSTKAWSNLIRSVLDSSMNITGSWAIKTERSAAGLKKKKAFLASSVTVSCRPSQRSGYGSFKEVKREIESTVQREVEELYRLGFRGADLLTACFGQAVSVFGQYKRVEKADGSEVSVTELLELARESAFVALLKGFAGDDPTKFYIAWLQLYGFGEAEFDDAAKFSRVGLTINVADLVAEHLFIKKGNKLTLAGFADRVLATKTLGEVNQSILIDQIHRSLALYKASNRQQLLLFINKHAATAELPFWRVLTALVEVLPAGSDDQKQAAGLLNDKESVLRESTQLAQQRPSLIQGQLELS